MPFTKLQFKPGIVSDVTAYTNEGGFVDGDLVRFRLGFPEKFGGWAKEHQILIKDLLDDYTIGLLWMDLIFLV